MDFKDKDYMDDTNLMRLRQRFIKDLIKHFFLYLLDLLFPSVSDRWFSPKATPKTLPHNNFPAAADIHALARGPGGKVIHCFAIPQPSKDSVF